MTRNQKLLAGIDLATSIGIEIGALDKPVIPPSSPHVFYVDHADTPALREKYRNDASVDVASIVNVGGVWGERTLAEITTPVAPADFIVASHVIEHVPDLITWLDELSSVLKADGEIRLAIPDKRYTFDLLREETQIADVLVAHMTRARVPQPRSVVDFAFNMVHVNCGYAWAGLLEHDKLEHGYTPEQAMNFGQKVLKTGEYIDVHCWVFTPQSFAKLMEQLAAIGLVQLECSQFFDTELNTYEFFVTLKKSDSQEKAVSSWKWMQARIAAARHQKLMTDFNVDAPASDLLRRKEEEVKALTEQIQAGNAAKATEIARMSAELDEINREIAAIRNSRSWRLTAPLRALRSLIKKP